MATGYEGMTSREEVIKTLHKNLASGNLPLNIETLKIALSELPEDPSLRPTKVEIRSAVAYKANMNKIRIDLGIIKNQTKSTTLTNFPEFEYSWWSSDGHSSDILEIVGPCNQEIILQLLSKLEKCTGISVEIGENTYLYFS
ncbi:MAG: hypothetical protein Q7S34_04500 [bacterium]|nr:hypothetical protein [bacterium]